MSVWLWMVACTGPSTDTLATPTLSAADTALSAADTAVSPPADTAADTGTAELCTDDHARETWQTFGQGFLSGFCQGCHATLAVDRRGAPDSVVFDTEADAWAWAERILARAAGPAPTMPPAGGPGPDQLLRLELWLRCETPPTR